MKKLFQSVEPLLQFPHFLTKIVFVFLGCRLSPSDIQFCEIAFKYPLRPVDILLSGPHLYFDMVAVVIRMRSARRRLAGCLAG